MTRTLGLCLLVMLGAAFLRFGPLPHEAVWVDELFTRHVLRQSPGEAMQVIRWDLVHPPLYYYLERPFYALLGDTPLGLRALSLLCGLLLVAAVARFTLELTGGEAYAALAAATLVAVSDLQVTQAQNARSYALYALEILAIAWAFHRMTQDPSRPGPKVAYAVLGVLAVLTHYVASLFLLALAPAALLSAQRRRLVRNWFLLSLPAALALLSWGLYVLPIYRAKHGLGQLTWIPTQDWASLRVMGARLFGAPGVEHGVRASILAAVALLGLGVWIWRRPACRLSSSRAAIALVMGLAVIPASLLFAAGWLTRGSFWVDRHLLPSQAFVAIGAGLCLALVARYRPILAHLALAGLIVLNDPLRLIGRPLPRNVPYDMVATELHALRAAGEPIVATWEGIPWPVNYYLADPDSVQVLVIGRDTPTATLSLASREGAATPYRNFIGARPRVAMASRVWLLRQPTEHAVADSLIGQGWRVRSTRRYQGIHVDELGRP
jgi:hypothetical protein